MTRFLPARARLKARWRVLCVRLTAIAFLLASLRVAQAEQYPHEFAGQLDGGGRISCVQYFVLRQEAQQCVQLTSSAPSIQGEVCSTVAGPLLAVYSPAADRNLFTARLVGPQVQMLPLTGCQVTDREEREEKARDCDDSDPEHESVVYGLMSGLLPGLYRLEVQWLYTGFSYGKDKIRVNGNDTRAVMSASVSMGRPSVAQAKAATAALTAYDECAFCADKRAFWPTCNRSDVDGSWLMPLSAGASVSVPTRLATVYDKQLLHYQPKGCHWLPTADIDLKECLKEDDKHICFVGDSQTRHMFNGFVDALNNPGAMMTVVGNWTDKSTYQHDKCSYILTTYGDGWVDKQLDKCTHVIFNFGQWPLSPRPPARWSAAHFARAVRSLLADIRKYRTRQPDTKFYWASINTHAIAAKHQTCEDILDFRTQPFVELFNAVAAQMMAQHGISVIKTGELTSHLTELSYDTSHYHWAGSVGHYITEYVANVLCAQK